MTDTYAHKLKPGDIITDGYGVYRVTGVNELPSWSVLGISVSTIAGRVVNALVRGRYEMFNVLARPGWTTGTDESWLAGRELKEDK